MSEKLKFIRDAAKHNMPFLDWDLDKSINYGIQLWKRLEQRDLTPKPRGPNQKIDYWGKLTTRQQGYFTRFWDAFNYKSKSNKKKSIYEFYQLGDLDDDTYELIIYGAGKTAEERPSLTQTPIGADQWLKQSRFEGYTLPTKADKAAPNRAEINAEIYHCNNMIGQYKDDPEMLKYWQDQRKKLQSQI